MRRRLSILLLSATATLVACDKRPPLEACVPATSILFPKPRFVQIASSGFVVNTVCVDAAAFPVLQLEIEELVKKHGIRSDSTNCDWTIKLSQADPLLQGTAGTEWIRGATSSDRFAVNTLVKHGRMDTTIHSNSSDGAYWAIRETLDLVGNNSVCVPMSTLVDYPSFSTRGVVESFDGAIYTPTDRLQLIELAGRVRLNRWLYGPKFDHYTHEKWAEPYPADEGKVIADAARLAREQHIRFGWAISPGISNWDEPPGYSIKYSSTTDFDKLTQKIETVRALGATDFALFLDDIHEKLAWPEDVAAFADLTEAHISLINRLSDYLRSKDPTGKLIFVGTWYTNAFVGWESYVARLGASIAPEVELFWTGPTVVSTTITKADMVDVNQRFGRPVLIWDNFPGSPVSYSGREQSLYEAVTGIYSNPVVNEAGHFPTSDYAHVLGTVGDYLWNSEAYDSVESWSNWQLVLQQ